jgi:hypothetical protein
MSKRMIYDRDPYLKPFEAAIKARHARIEAARDRISGPGGDFPSSVNNHLYYGLH